MEDLLKKLELQEKEIIEVGRRLYHAYRNTYHFDYYCIAQLNRSINLLNGFVQLARSDNFIAAFPLVRIHLDTLQRMYAFHLIEKNPDEIVVEILSGKKQIKDYQNKNTKKKLNDGELSKELSSLPDFEWVKKVYNAGNEFVHFSDKHLKSSTISDTENQTLNSIISIGSKLIGNDEKEGACIYMHKITDSIILFIDSWIEQKKTYP
jgi:hypothetical protein